MNKITYKDEIPDGTSDTGFIVTKVDDTLLTLPWFRDMVVGKVCGIIDAKLPNNGYGFLELIFQRWYQMWQLDQVMEIGCQFTGFYLWRELCQRFPGTKYTAYDRGKYSDYWESGCTNISIYNWTWPCSLWDEGADNDIFYHHRLWPQIWGHDEEDYFRAMDQRLRPLGLYLSVTRWGSSNPPPISQEYLTDNTPYHGGLLAIKNQHDHREDAGYDVLVFQKA